MPRSPAIYRPSIPQWLLDKFASTTYVMLPQSLIYSKRFDDFRHTAIVEPDTTNLDTEVVLSIETAFSGRFPEPFLAVMKIFQVPHNLTCSRGLGRTWLHWAAINGDVALAFECVRLGLEIDKKDVEGNTPLLIVIRAVYAITIMSNDLRNLQQALSAEPSDSETEAHLAKMWARCCSIASMLLEQGADPNCANLKGISPLFIGCQTAHWGLVEELLKYGAKPSLLVRDTDPYSVLSDPEDKTKFDGLVHNYDPSRWTPPSRKCPCLSDNLLSQCHESSAILYPLEFTCKCGSRKTHGDCCAKRNLQLAEAWKKENGIIWEALRHDEPVVVSDPALLPVFDAFTKYMDTMKPDLDRFEPLLNGAIQRHKQMMVIRMRATGRADPAYVYAFLSSRFAAMPFNNELTKIARKLFAERWNGWVDEYIAEGLDSRAAVDVEKEANIDVSGRPLYKRCEAAGCRKYEVLDVAKLKRCGDCKKILYCSADCQKVDWRTHKTACERGTHKEQMLRSQRAYQEEIDNLMLWSLRRIKEMDEVADAFSGEAMEGAGFYIAATPFWQALEYSRPRRRC